MIGSPFLSRLLHPERGGDPQPSRPPEGASLCVLASGSAGNCSVLALRRGPITRLCLIDLGLSPRRTFRLLARAGLRPDQVDHALLTHLDSDHLHAGWFRGLPPHAAIRLHSRHARLLRDRGWDGPARRRRGPPRVVGFDEAFDLEPGVRVSPLMMSHDELGVCTLRLDLPGMGAGTLGFATDVGRVTHEMVEHFRARHAGVGVDVLAIESNYCPKMQIASDRPPQLKRRIMGGRGHLSNHEALEAIEAIGPREHVVLLHLSRECNDPALVRGLHEGADYALTITAQDRPTRWVRIPPSTRPPRPARLSVRLANSENLWAALADPQPSTSTSTPA